jgi:hypothetical protein
VDDGSTQAARGRERQVAITCIHVPASPEMPWLIAMELYLFVSSRMGKVYKGNQ